MNEIHQSFIKSLVLIGAVTLISMVSARYLVSKALYNHYKTPNFTTQESQIHPK